MTEVRSKLGRIVSDLEHHYKKFKTILRRFGLAGLLARFEPEAASKDESHPKSTAPGWIRSISRSQRTRTYEGSYLVFLMLAWLASLIPLIPTNLTGIPTFWIWGTAALPFGLLWGRANRRLRSLRLDLTAECRALTKYAQSAEPLLRRIKSSPGERLNYDDIINLTPSVDREPTIHAKTLIEEIASGQLHLLSAPAESILHPHRQQLNSRFAEITLYGTLCTRLGILGTFVGLVVALASLSDLFSGAHIDATSVPGLGANSGNQGDNSQLTAPVNATLGRLSFAFVTSIYGLIASIVISVNSGSVRNLLDEFFRTFREAFSFGREFVQRLALSDPAIHVSLSRIGDALGNMEQRLYDHGNSVSESLQNHGHLVNKQTKLFSEAASGMVAVQSEWQSAFEHLSQVSGNLENSTTKTMEIFSGGFRDAAERLKNTIESLDKGKQELVAATNDVAKYMIGSDEHWSTRIEGLIDEMNIDRAAQNQFRESFDKSADSISQSVQEVGLEFANVNYHAVKVSDQCQEILAAILQLSSSLKDSRQLIRAKNSVGKLYRVSVLIMLLILILMIGITIEIVVLGDPVDFQASFRTMIANMWKDITRPN